MRNALQSLQLAGHRMDCSVISARRLSGKIDPFFLLGTRLTSLSFPGCPPV